MPDYDEFGIPIKKPSKQPEVDEFGVPIKKKVGGTGGGASATGGTTANTPVDAATQQKPKPAAEAIGLPLREQQPFYKNIPQQQKQATVGVPAQLKNGYYQQEKKADDNLFSLYETANYNQRQVMNTTVNKSVPTDYISVNTGKSVNEKIKNPKKQEYDLYEKQKSEILKDMSPFVDKTINTLLENGEYKNFFVSGDVFDEGKARDYFDKFVTERGGGKATRELLLSKFRSEAKNKLQQDDPMYQEILGKKIKENGVDFKQYSKGYFDKLTEPYVKNADAITKDAEQRAQKYLESLKPISNAATADFNQYVGGLNEQVKQGAITEQQAKQLYGQKLDEYNQQITKINNQYKMMVQKIQSSVNSKYLGIERSVNKIAGSINSAEVFNSLPKEEQEKIKKTYAEANEEYYRTKNNIQKVKDEYGNPMNPAIINIIQKGLVSGWNRGLSGIGNYLQKQGHDGNFTKWLMSKETDANVLAPAQYEWSKDEWIKRIASSSSTSIGASAPILLPTMATGLATGGTSVPAMVMGTIATGGVGFLGERVQNTGDVYKQVLEQTGDENKALDAANNFEIKQNKTLPLYFIGGLGSVALLKSKSVLQKVGGALLEQAEEIPTEYIQSYNEAQATQGYNKDFTTFVKENPEIAADTFFSTLGQSGAFAATGKMMNTLVSKAPNGDKQLFADMVQKEGVEFAINVLDQYKKTGVIDETAFANGVMEVQKVDQLLRSFDNMGISGDKAKALLVLNYKAEAIKKKIEQEKMPAVKIMYEQQLKEVNERIKNFNENPSYAVFTLPGGNNSTMTIFAEDIIEMERNGTLDEFVQKTDGITSNDPQLNKILNGIKERVGNPAEAEDGAFVNKEQPQSKDVVNSPQEQGEVVENKQQEQVNKDEPLSLKKEDLKKMKKVFHYSANENLSELEDREMGAWFTDNPSGYQRRQGVKGKVERFIDVDKLNLAKEKEVWKAGNGNWKEGVRKIKDAGYDGIYQVADGDKNYLIFDINKTYNNTQSGIKPTETSETIPERVQKPVQKPERLPTPQPTKRQKAINDIIDRIAAYGKMDKRDKAAVAKEENAIQQQASEIGYKFDKKGNRLLNEDGKPQQKRNAVKNGDVVKGFDRAAYSDKTNAAIDNVVNNPDLVNGIAFTGVDGRRLNKKQKTALVQSLKDGKPNYAAKALFDFIEDIDAEGGIEIEDVTTGQNMKVPVDEYFAAAPLLEDEINILLNEDAYTLADVEPYFEPLFTQEQNDIVNETELTEDTGTVEQQPADESETGKPSDRESGKPPVEPPSETSGEENDGEEGEVSTPKKKLLNKAYEGDNTETLKEKIAAYGLNYEQQTHEDAKATARKIINDIGIDDALKAVRTGIVKDAEAAFIWSEAIDMVGERIAKATTQEDIEELEAQEAGLLNEFDLQARGAGRFISALKDIYTTSEFSYKIDYRIEQYKKANGGTIPPEVLEKYEKLDAEYQELKSKYDAAEQRAKEAEEKLAMDNIAESVERENQQAAPKKTTKEKAKQIADKLRKGKINRPGLFMSNTPAGLAWDAAIEAAATTLEVTAAVADAINAGITKLKETDWYKNLTGKQQSEAEKEIANYINSTLAEDEQAEIEDEVKGTVRMNKGGKLIIPHKVIRDYVKNGIRDINALVDALKKDYPDVLENVSERTIRDTITKYGKTINQNKEEVEKEIRKMKRIGRDLSKLEDIAKGKRPVRSGLQRDELTAEERDLMKQVREGLKTLPPDTSREAQQLKTALDGIKTRLRNQIEDLKIEIETKKKLAKSQGNVAYDEEAKALSEQRDELKKIREEIFGQELTDEERADKIAAVTARAAEKINKQIADNDIAFKKKNDVTSPKLEAARKALKEAKAKLDELRELSGIANQRKVEAAKRRVQKQIEEMERRLKEKDFSKKETKPLTEDNELIKLKAEKQRIHEEYEKERYKAELKNRTSWQKIVDNAIEIWGLTRVFMATGELSFIMIQGGLYTTKQLLTNPNVIFGALKKMISHFSSEKRFNEHERFIKSQAYYPVIKASKLALSEYDSKLTAREELGVSGWANHVWDFVSYPTKLAGKSAYEKVKMMNPLKAIERAGVAYMNHVRLMTFLQGMQKLEMEGKTFQDNPKAYKDVADVINTFSGRASLGKRGEAIAKELSLLFFSPRNTASILKQATPYFFIKLYKWRGEDGKISVAQKMAVSDYMTYLTITGGMLLAAAQYFNNDDDDETGVSFDPTSSDFLKVKMGDTRVDPFGGRSQMVVYTIRQAFDRTTQSNGKQVKLGEGLFTPTRYDLSVRLLQNKLAPTMAALVEYAQTKNVKHKDGTYTREDKFGKEYSFSNKFSESVQPIFWETVREIHEDNPAQVAAFLDVLAAIGVGIQVYGKKDKKKKEESTDTRKRRETVQ